MIRKFVNRTTELTFLQQWHEQPGSKLVIIYGRRRIGKTELLKQFLQDKDHVFFLADKRGTDRNVRRLADQLGKVFGDIPPRASSFDDIFEHIKVRRGEQPFVVVIDEFPYLVERDDAIPSVFQLICDEVLPDTRVSLIILGSSIQMMEQLLSEKSPLYGRQTGMLKIKPFGIVEAHMMFPSDNLADLVHKYGFFGGSPFYLSLLDPHKGLMDNTTELVLLRSGRLFEEVEYLLREELREPILYKMILEAMAFGHTTVTTIANYVGVNAKDLSSYLRSLVDLHLIRKEKPVLAPPNSKTTRYYLADNFFIFWFYFVQPNLMAVEVGNLTPVLELLKDSTDYIGRFVFEQVCAQFVTELNRRGQLPFMPQVLGRWWHKETEVDLVGLNKQSQDILLIECKWREQVKGRKILHQLERKAQAIPWKRESWSEHYMIIAKSFADKPPKNCRYFDLEDLTQVFFNHQPDQH